VKISTWQTDAFSERREDVHWLRKCENWLLKKYSQVSVTIINIM